MQNIRRLWPMAILVSGLLLTTTDLPLLDGGASVATLGAAGFLMLLICWREAPAWIGSARAVPTPASRITIRIRCSR
jgi:hypothetical protein